LTRRPRRPTWSSIYPKEAARILAEAIDYFRQAQLAAPKNVQLKAGSADAR
jgi:hypothetical protein